jgi:hypothetical protein
LRITHFSETTKDRNLIFDMGGDDNVKLVHSTFFIPGAQPHPAGESVLKKRDRDPHPLTIYIYDQGD